MTEGEWLACDDPRRMLQYGAGDGEFHLAGVLCRHPSKEWYSDRKLRLFACACCRQAWDRLTDNRSRRAVEVAERFADGLATREDLAATGRWSIHAPNISDLFPSADWPWVDQPSPTVQSALLRCIFGNPWRPVQRPYKRCGHCGGELAPLKKSLPPLLSVCRSCSRYGPLWADVVQGEPWPWLTPTVTALATAIYTENRFDDLPYLADALEEAGCCDQQILDHLRGPGPHCRGCFCVDLILGKS